MPPTWLYRHQAVSKHVQTSRFGRSTYLNTSRPSPTRVRSNGGGMSSQQHRSRYWRVHQSHHWSTSHSRTTRQINTSRPATRIIGTGVKTARFFQRNTSGRSQAAVFNSVRAQSDLLPPPPLVSPAHSRHAADRSPHRRKMNIDNVIYVRCISTGHRDCYGNVTSFTKIKHDVITGRQTRLAQT